MNRIKLGPLAKMPAPLARRVTTTSATFEQHSATSLEYSLFIPMHYEKNYSYPLIVWLHSDDDDHRQLLRVMPQVSARNFVAVSVNGFRSAGRDKYSWPQTAEAIETTQNHIREAIDNARCRLNVSATRILIGGMGEGGTMAFRVAFQRPEWFTGVASINGGLPVNLTPLANLPSCRELPVFWAHGRQSNSFPESRLCHQLRLLHIAGFSVTLRQYPFGEQVASQTFHDLNVWFMDLIKKSSSPSSIID